MVEFSDTMRDLFDTVVDLPDSMVDLPDTMILGSWFFLDFILFFLGSLLEMVGYGGKLELDYHDQPRLTKTKQDQTRGN